ncbi:MAG: hypothetical protein LBG65_01885 [Puniceicoccales bacterium]|jgi:hypothetical protein|nr:hypothetical protein [Puniceicoccales bacterium]
MTYDEDSTTPETGVTDSPQHESPSAQDSQSAAPLPVPSEKQPDGAFSRIAESPFEASHADLPPLSTIPGAAPAVSAAVSKDGDDKPARRGIARGGNGGAGSLGARPAIGVVENLIEIHENLSGKFANGYDENRRGVAVDLATPETSAEKPNAGGVVDFVPPAARKPFRAEVDPERSRGNPDERRQERFGRRERFERNRACARDTASETALAQKGGEWEVRGRSEKEADAGADPAKPAAFVRQGGQAAKTGQRAKIYLPPTEIPVQQEESIWKRLKNWLTDLFAAGKPEDKGRCSSNEDCRRRDTPRDWKDGGRDSRDNGRFRRGNQRSHGAPRSFNRDNRHHPHSHGGNNRPRRNGE